jgi:hypothetical protein
VPGAEVAEGELDAWRTGYIQCDHCRAARHRKETFILRGEADGHPTYKQVGRQCLAAFLGGASAASIVARLGWADLVRGAADEESDGDGGGAVGSSDSSGSDVHDPAEFLSWCCSIARLDGFISRAAAQQREGVTATSTAAEWLLGGSPGNSARWAAARARLAPQDEDRERAAAALAWARALPGGSDYEQNLQIVASQSVLRPKHAGILASAVPAYARVLGEQVARAARGPGEHYGKVGERYLLDLTVERVVPIATDYGDAVIASMRDAAGRLFMWRTGSSVGSPGDRVQIRGSVKRHSEYKGELQTELTRCKVASRTPPAHVGA